MLIHRPCRINDFATIVSVRLLLRGTYFGQYWRAISLIKTLFSAANIYPPPPPSLLGGACVVGNRQISPEAVTSLNERIWRPFWCMRKPAEYNTSKPRFVPMFETVHWVTHVVRLILINEKPSKYHGKLCYHVEDCYFTQLYIYSCQVHSNKWVERLSITAKPSSQLPC